MLSYFKFILSTRFLDFIPFFHFKMKFEIHLLKFDVYLIELKVFFKIIYRIDRLEIFIKTRVEI